MTTRVITLVNEKGGVGKTTSTAELSAVLAATGKRVLAIDTDHPQHSLQRWVNQVGLDDTPFDIATVKDASELGAVQEVAEDYDIVLIDTPGSRSNFDLVRSFIDVSDFLLVITEVDGLALEPADSYIDELIIPSGKPYGVMLVRWDVRRPKKLARAQEFFAGAEKPVFNSVIRSYGLFADSYEDGVFATTGPRRTANAHKAAGDYERAALELMSVIATL